MFSNTLNRSGCFNWLVTTPCFFCWNFVGWKLTKPRYDAMLYIVVPRSDPVRSGKFPFQVPGFFHKKPTICSPKKKGGLVSEWKTFFFRKAWEFMASDFEIRIGCWCYDYWDDVNRLRGGSGDSFPQFSGGALALSRITWGWSLS